jgi:hypothetical protein
MGAIVSPHHYPVDGLIGYLQQFDMFRLNPFRSDIRPERANPEFQ